MADIVRVSDIYNESIATQANLSKPDLLIRESQRIERVKLYWNLFRGIHWEDAELDETDPTFVYNKTKVIVNKLISHLVGKPFTLGYHNDEVEQILAPYVKWILKNSGGAGLLGFEAAQMGGV